MSDGLFEIRLGGTPAAVGEQSARRAEPPPNTLPPRPTPIDALPCAPA